MREGDDKQLVGNVLNVICVRICGYVWNVVISIVDANNGTQQVFQVREKKRDDEQEMVMLWNTFKRQDTVQQ